MSLNLFYSFREGMAGLRRARTATFITVSTMTVALTLLGIFLVLTFNVRRIVELFRERMDLEVFIDNSLSFEEVRELEKNISSTQGVDSVVFISKDEALERFRKEWGLDPVALYGENNLPPSFVVSLKRGQRSSDVTEAVAKELEELNGVDEVVYHRQLYRIVDRYSRIVLLADGTLFFIVLLSAVFLVSNTLRLTILSQKRTIQIMELVGAKEDFIRRPYIIQGILQGGIGGTVGSIVVWGGVEVVKLRFPHLLEVTPLLIFFPLLLGVLLGLVGSRVGLSRFLRVR